MCSNEHNSYQKLLLTGYVFLDTNSKTLIFFNSLQNEGTDCCTWLTICCQETNFKSADVGTSFNQHNRVVIRSSKIWKFSTGTWRRNGCCSRGFSSCLTRRCWRSWDRPRTLTLSRRTFSPCSTTSRRSNSTRNSTRSSSP